MAIQAIGCNMVKTEKEYNPALLSRFIIYLRKFQYMTSDGGFSCRNLLFWRERSN